MTRKEKMNLLLSKVPEEQKEAFVAELRAAETKKAREELFKKYKITVTEEEKSALTDVDNKVSDDELDHAAGGCYNSSCNTDCSCN